MILSLLPHITSGWLSSSQLKRSNQFPVEIDLLTPNLAFQSAMIHRMFYVLAGSLVLDTTVSDFPSSICDYCLI